MVKRKKGRYVLYTKDGKHKIASHKTLSSAMAQEAAIRIAKARRAGHKIPKKKGKD